MGNGLFGQANDFLVAISEPAGGGDVGGVALLTNGLFALGLTRFFGFEESEGLLRSDGVCDVSEGGGSDELFLEVGFRLSKQLKMAFRYHLRE